jgi:hypothetical protein
LPSRAAPRGGGAAARPTKRMSRSGTERLARPGPREGRAPRRGAGFPPDARFAVARSKFRGAPASGEGLRPGQAPRYWARRSIGARYRRRSRDRSLDPRQRRYRDARLPASPRTTRDSRPRRWHGPVEPAQFGEAPDARPRSSRAQAGARRWRPGSDQPPSDPPGDSRRHPSKGEEFVRPTLPENLGSGNTLLSKRLRPLLADLRAARECGPLPFCAER